MKIKRSVKYKIKNLNSEEKIIHLTNMLCREINKAGESLFHPDIRKGFGSLDIYIHRYLSDDPIIRVGNICKNYSFCGKPIKGLK